MTRSGKADSGSELVILVGCYLPCIHLTHAHKEGAGKALSDKKISTFESTSLTNPGCNSVDSKHALCISILAYQIKIGGKSAFGGEQSGAFWHL